MKTFIFLVLLCALLGAFGQIFFKLGSKNLSLSVAGTLLNFKLIAGLALYGIATILFVLALKNLDLSFAYPLIATSYIWVWLLSIFVLGEPLILSRAAGTLLIILGVVVLVL